MKKEKDKKRGILNVLLESFTKAGGCCGPGESCGGAERPKNETDSEEDKEPEEPAET